MMSLIVMQVTAMLNRSEYVRIFFTALSAALFSLFKLIIPYPVILNTYHVHYLYHHFYACEF